MGKNGREEAQSIQVVSKTLLGGRKRKKKIASSIGKRRVVADVAKTLDP